MNASGPGPSVLVLDVDGTLVDTTYLHVLAWWRAFADHGHEVSCVDVHRAVGRGSGDLVATLLGGPDDAVVQAHARYWADLRPDARPFHRVAELVRTCAGRGVRVVLATSGDEADTAAFLDKVGVRDVLHAVVSAGDVAQAKPAPDVVRQALEAAGAAPERALMVGDTVFDVRAATAAGVRCVGVLAGGIGEQELRHAGAVAVYPAVSDLLDDLEDGPLARLLDPR